MKKLLSILILLFFFVAQATANAPLNKSVDKGPNYAAGELMLRFTENFFDSDSFKITKDLVNKHVSVGNKEIDEFFNKIETYNIRSSFSGKDSAPNYKNYSQLLILEKEMKRTFIIFFSKNYDAKLIAKKIKLLQGIESASPNYFFYTQDAMRRPVQ